jgi:hypothetical protein
MQHNSFNQTLNIALIMAHLNMIMLHFNLF